MWHIHLLIKLHAAGFKTFSGKKQDIASVSENSRTKWIYLDVNVFTGEAEILIGLHIVY